MPAGEEVIPARPSSSKRISRLVSKRLSLKLEVVGVVERRVRGAGYRLWRCMIRALYDRCRGYEIV
jgi:hypothetical protein